MRAGIVNRIMHDERKRREKVLLERTGIAQQDFDRKTGEVPVIPTVPVNEEDA